MSEFLSGTLITSIGDSFAWHKRVIRKRRKFNDGIGMQHGEVALVLESTALRYNGELIEGSKILFKNKMYYVLNRDMMIS